jgi:hypothetical protein
MSIAFAVCFLIEDCVVLESRFNTNFMADPVWTRNASSRHLIPVGLSLHVEQTHAYLVLG